MVLTSFKTKIEQRWYFDNGSSRPMTSNKRLLSNVLPSSLDSVTFGDDVKGNVLWSGSLNIPSFPKLGDALFVNGLKANLISIIQLCD